VNISFAPKITVGKAGSGMHIHMRLMKDGKSATVENGKLSDPARKAIAGILDLSPALTAFGNTIPTSYLRLVPHQEAPTNICWGDRNRSVLIRVPLGWVGANEMIKVANPNYSEAGKDFSEKQTYEFRCPDGSADIYLLLAGLVVGTQHGLEMKDALAMAEKLYVDVNIFHDEHKAKLATLAQLPNCCWDSADKLNEQRAAFELNDVYPKGLIDTMIKRLKSWEDKDLSERLYGKNDEIKALVDQHLHCC
jgi:glutamine synthetase